MAAVAAFGRALAARLQRLLSSRSTVAFGLGLGAIVVLVTLLLGQAIVALQALRTEPHDNLQWAIYQLGSEFQKFEISVLAMADGNADLAAVRQRFDILYSRIDIIDGPIFRDALADGVGVDQRSRLLAFRDQVDRLLQEPAGQQQGDRLIGLITGMAPTVASLAQATLQHVTERSDQLRGNLEQAVQRAVVGLAGFAVVLSAVVLVLFWQRRTLDRQTATLERSAQELREAQRIARLGTFVWDFVKDQVVWSDELAELFGLPVGETMRGAQFTQLVHPDDRERVLEIERRAMERSAATGQPAHRDTRYRVTRPDGSILHVDALAELRADPGGRPLAMTSTLRDVTQEVEREAALTAAKLTAERATAAKSEFLAMMSHELRTPLNGVMGTLSAVDETELSAAQRELIDVARNSADTLLSLLNDVLDLSKIEAGKLELESTDFELSALVRSVVDLYARSAAARSIAFTADIPPDVPRYVLGDAPRLRQILLNFTSNALKFTLAGSVRLTVEQLSQSTGAALWLRFGVHDTGIGIPADRQAEVFSDFNQLDSSYSRRFGGTGLGLAICRRLAGLMQGRIGFESTEGVGSVFWVDLPFQPARISAPVPVLSLSAPDTPPLKVLVAEDNLTNQMVVSRLLASLGHSVDVVSNGAEAVEAVQARTYDVVLMDVSMPDIDGVEATRRIRQLGARSSRTPIIALTANAMTADRDRYMAAGMDGLLSKPIVRASLAAALSELPGTGDRTSGPAISPALAGRIAELGDELGQDLVQPMLQAYVEDLRRNLSGLVAAVRTGATAEIERYAHSLRGLALNLRADALRDAAQAVETAAQHPQVSINADASVTSLADRVGEIIDMLNTIKN